MSISLPTASTVSEAWLLALEGVAALPGGLGVHVITTVTEPGTELLPVRTVIDSFLAAVAGTSHPLQAIETVAETIFPSSLYQSPGKPWSPASGHETERALDDAASNLYDAYCDMLPILRTATGNARGTYFSRMVTWPGRDVGGINQLSARISSLRATLRAGRGTVNTHDIDLAADAASCRDEDDDLRGLQVYAADDMRPRGFPCLTHIDMTLYEGRLHATAVYRHQYLIEKAYGNLLGLSRLLAFICEQAGCTMGELVVHATMADAQLKDFGSAAATLVHDARLALNGAGTTIAARPARPVGERDGYASGRRSMSRAPS